MLAVRGGECIVELRRFPNFKGAKILAYCLNVMGFTDRGGASDRDIRVLQRAVLSWTRRNYSWLRREHPRVAEACLINGVSFDRKHTRLVKTYPADGLRLKPERFFFEVEP